MNNYSALVGRGTTDYKTLFAPDSSLLAEEGDGSLVMLSFTGSTPQLKWRIWIPPGTRSLQASLYTYASPPESKVLMRMHQPPSGDLNSVNPENSAAVDSTNVLASLLAGAEVPCHAPEYAGTVKLSTGRMDSPVVTTTGGWLYVNALQVPGQLVFKMESYLSVDKAQYLKWYETAVWDEEGNPVYGEQKPVGPVPLTEQEVLKRVLAAGLVEPLRVFSGVKTDADLIKAVQKSGMWAALMELARLKPNP